MLAQQGIHTHSYNCIHTYTQSSTDIYVKKNRRQVHWGVFPLCLKGHCVRGGKLTMHFLTSYNQSICVKGRDVGMVFSFPVSPQLWSEKGLELALSYPSLYKLKTSIDRLRASALVSLAGSSGFSEAHACDDDTETQAVALAHTQRFCSSRPSSHIPILDSEQLSLPRRYGIEGSDKINQKR